MTLVKVRMSSFRFITARRGPLLCLEQFRHHRSCRRTGYAVDVPAFLGTVESAADTADVLSQ